MIDCERKSVLNNYRSRNLAKLFFLTMILFTDIYRTINDSEFRAHEVEENPINVHPSGMNKNILLLRVLLKSRISTCFNN